MIRQVYSEVLKTKNSIIIWSTIISVVITVLCEILVFMSKTNIDFITRMNIQVSLMFMLMTLNSVIIVNRAFHIEKDANNFQNILTSFKKRKIWISKIFVLIIYEIIAFITAQFVGGIFSGAFEYFQVVSISIVIQVFVSINLHLLLQIKFGDLANIIFGIIEIILIVFSTNIPMKNWYYFPCCYGYKIYEYFGSLNSFHWLIVMGVIMVLMLLNTVLTLKIKK